MTLLSPPVSQSPNRADASGLPSAPVPPPPGQRHSLRALAFLVGCLVLAAGAAVAFGLLDPIAYEGEAPFASVSNASPTAASTSPSAPASGRPHRTRAAWMLTSGAIGLLADQLSALRPPAVPITVPFVPGARGEEGDVLTYGGINYADPTAGGVPLQWVEGSEDTWLTPGFTLGDFAPRDGASFARIDPALVESLERLRLRAGSLAIVSGYRHPHHNAVVGGSGHSLHTAGRAADVWSPAHSPLDLARLALLTLGCDIGLGLGPRTLHVDVRGELTTWTYEGAPLSEVAFDAWALTQCGRPVPPSLALAAAAAWLADSVATEPGTPSASSPTSGLSPEALVERFAPAIAEVTRRGRMLEGAGGIVVDVTSGAEPGIRFVRASSPEAVSLGLAPLISWCMARRSDEYVAYVVLSPVGVSTGITNVTPTTVPTEGPAPSTTPSNASNAGPREAPSTPQVSDLPRSAAPASGDQWAIVVASLATRDAARERATSLRARLPSVGAVAVVEAPALGRYRVTLGPYGSVSGAQRALEQLEGEITDDAWILAL